MSEFLDELARSLAKPMPRSRAIRVLGVAVASAAVPFLRPRSAAARSESTFTPSCHTAKCRSAPDTLLCKCHEEPTGSPIEPTMCNHICCDPCEHECDCPPGAAGCKPKARPSPAGAKRCGSKCCDPKEYCADASRSLCCNQGESECVVFAAAGSGPGGGTQATCCTSKEYCAANDKKATCCPLPGRPCAGGCCQSPRECVTDSKGNQVCRCPNPKPCRDNCCGKNEFCCPNKTHCCPPGETCCGDADCCRPDQECVDLTIGGRTRKTCINRCAAGERRCGGSPLTSRTLACCPNGKCCDEDCCGGDEVCVTALSAAGNRFKLCKSKCKDGMARCNFICCKPGDRAYKKLPNGRVRCVCAPG